MGTFLFDKIVFGPVHSRRLGLSLGINLLPVTKKYCNFNCIYCECGWSNIHKITLADLPTRAQIRAALDSKLQSMQKEGRLPDVITYAGNGEPTMHPDFAEIIDDSIALRNQFSPEAQIAVLTNSTLIHKKHIAHALTKVDQCVLKLDSVIPETFNTLNCPAPGIDLDTILFNLIHFPGKKIIQTMFLRGSYEGVKIDNTTDEELNGLIEAYHKIKPGRVMIYTFERDTPSSGLVKVPAKELEEIGERIRKEGFRI
jgi:wyosine [tRNA(Phe)-imidazoG37] synthetase (radical SAM superfamily)